MPKLLNPDADTDVASIPGLNGYQFSAVRTDRLGAAEYTLVTIAVDGSSSVIPFQDILRDSVKKTIEACKKSPRANNIMVRVIQFGNDIVEIHGFKLLAEIDLAVYDSLVARGNTALFDAAASAVSAMTEYGRVLQRQDFGVNGIMFIITDGDDTCSKFPSSTVRTLVDEAVSGEILESFISVLIGVNAQRLQAELEAFRQDAGLTQYMDAGDATPGNLAKLAAFVSRSVSSQANAQGTGQAGNVSASIVI